MDSSEIARIANPYILISETQSSPAVLQLPDLSKWLYNRILGLGSKKHNEYFIKYSNQNRVRHENEEVQLWGIWDTYSKLTQINDERKYYNEAFNL